MSYDEIREANIKRNQEFLESIGLAGSERLDMGESLKRARPATKGTARRNKLQATDVVVRRSGRVTLERVRVELESLPPEDPKRAQLELDFEAMKTAKQESNFVPAEEADNSRYERLTEAEIPAVVPLNAEDGEAEGAWCSKITSKMKSKSKLTSSPVSKELKVVEQDVAKLTANRITSVFVHSSVSALLVAAGDKSGNFGMWLVDEQGDDGIFKFKPHVSNLCRIWTPSSRPSQITTGSYDGTIRCLDLNSSSPSFSLKHCSPDSLDESYYTDISETSKSPDVILASRSDGNICCIDFRASSSSYSWQAVSRVEKGGAGIKMNSIQELPTDSNYMVAAGQGGSVVLFDVRKSSVPLRALSGHKKSVNAAYASPDGKFIVSVSQDDTIRTWTNYLTDKYQCTTTSHNNHTGRWLSTLRPTFDLQQSATFCLGSMDQPRKINIWSCENESKPTLKVVASIMGTEVSSVCSRMAFHPTLRIVAGGNSSGRVHVAR